MHTDEPIPVRVVFRIDRHHGEVTAVFDDNDEWPNLTCYSHVGQHSTCSRDWVFGPSQRAATVDEFAPLLRELTSRGYDVSVGRRLVRYGR